jgi:hypothetical protein
MHIRTSWFLGSDRLEGIHPPFAVTYHRRRQMTGERAALLVQAEEHLFAARKELQISIERLGALAIIIGDPEAAKQLFQLGSELTLKMQDLNCDYFQRQMRDFERL